MHKYAVQITVADVRDGPSAVHAEGGEPSQVDQGAEQMVYAEATIALPLIAGYAYHKGSRKNRKARNLLSSSMSWQKRDKNENWLPRDIFCHQAELRIPPCINGSAGILDCRLG